jgi:hypothetical protein
MGLTAAGEFEVHGEATGCKALWHGDRARSNDGLVIEHAWFAWELIELDRGNGMGPTVAGEFEIHGKVTGFKALWHGDRARSTDGFVI